MRRLAAVTLLLAACRPPSRIAEPVVLPRVLPTLPACVLARAPRGPADTLRIVLPGAVDPAGAPAARDETERLVFAQLYEPLLRQDCAGNLAPGLAESWARLGDSAWRFRIRPGARFADGTAVTAAATVASLQRARLPWRVAAAGERDVVVHGGDDPRLPTALAAGRWAVTREPAADGWPVGTRGRIAPAERGVTLTNGSRVLVFTWTPGADPRDALDGAADAVLTDHPAAIEYASARAAFESLPLPWSRTYVVVAPEPQRPAIAAAGPWRDAVRVDARVATGPYWWASARCAGGGAPAPGRAGSPPRVVYAESDAAARSLAERLVARGFGPAVALPPEALRAAVAESSDIAILAIPRSASDPCRVLENLGLASRPAADVVALLDARLHLVVRAGRFGVVLDGNGTPRIDP